MIARAGGLVLLVPLASALGFAAIPLWLRLLLVALWITAVARPHIALVALALLVPFGSWLPAFVGAPPVRYTEALVLAALSGGLLAFPRPPKTALRPQRPGLVPPALVFFALAVASAAVMLEVMQIGTHSPWPFLRGFAVYLSRDYLVGPAGVFVGVADAALLVEGILLMIVVSRHARDGVMRPVQLFTATALAGALAAIVTLMTFVSTALEASSVGEFFWRVAFSRMGVHVTDVNAAGSFFAMTTIVALAIALNRRHANPPRRPRLRQAMWIGAAAMTACAMWIGGSRMALVATIGAIAVVAAAESPLRPQRWPRWAVVTAGVCAALLVSALALGLDPRPSAARTASRMVSMRADFMLTGLRMIASAPIFGVGIGRYYDMSGRFMPPSIYWFYYHENAHNNFLQVAGELGLAGLAAFVWMLGVMAVRVARGLRADPDDRLLAGAAAAIAAFVTTWMTSHPMLVAEVAFPFWMLAGAALARADGNAQPPRANATWSGSSRAPQHVAESGYSRTSRTTQITIAGVAIALALSVPSRARVREADLDLEKETFGFYGWEQDESGFKFRWASRRATFFIPASARELRLPIRALHIGRNTAPTDVTIEVAGRPFHRVVLPHDDWVTVRLRLPVPLKDERYWRIDIVTERTWSPMEMGSGDPRVLGVEVGAPITE